MPLRAASPARSETEVDISASLFAGEAIGRIEDQRYHISTEPVDILSATYEDNDEALIAGQQAAANRKSSNLKGRSVKKGGGFQALGLNTNLLKAITRKGYSVPTPIQRKAMPLILKDKDVVGMARTGSGKTAAFVIPLIEKVKAHSSRVGARALIMSPSRELALQTLQVVKDMGRGTDLRSVLLVGGDNLEDQFAALGGNPDVIVATPGRFLHLKVEMGLDLSSIRYVVFDEADRLFEMGFAAQLTEILHALPSSRQTMLFSATLPKTLVEFARAGLQDPMLVRLDADSKISPDLQSVFLTVKSSEKEGALLYLLQDIIHLPVLPETIAASNDDRSRGKQTKKRKRTEIDNNFDSSISTNPNATIIFAATKHHVEYVSRLLQSAGFAASYVYGSLDQTARKAQVQAFRSGITNILVVTDVAARGIDIPILANVINYDFPSQPKIFVHRVGRTARAGQKGWSYSLVHDADAPYLLDLQLFLGRKLIVGKGDGVPNYATDVVVGSLHRDNMQSSCEWIQRALADDVDVAALRSVALKGERLYQRTRNSASTESARRARSVVASSAWEELHPLFDNPSDKLEVEREKMLARLGGFRPQESIFEIAARRGGRKGNEEAVEAMRKIRSGLDVKKQKSRNREDPPKILASHHNNAESQQRRLEDEEEDMAELMSLASDEDLEVTFSRPQSKRKSQASRSEDLGVDFRDSEHFMPYTPTTHNLADDKAYGVHSGSNTNFAEAARGVTMDLSLDDAAKGFGEARGIMRWDKRQKKYVARPNDDDGSKGKRLVRGESGAKIAASFRSGRYDAWRRTTRAGRMPRVGDVESKSGSTPKTGGPRYKHQTSKAPKQADKFRGDYEKRKKQVKNAAERMRAQSGRKELQSVDAIRKQRNLKQRRREKNARPSRRPKR